MRKVMNRPGAQPLWFAKRDQLGPQGQGLCTTTTNPIELDEIARRRWLAISAGEFVNMHRGVAMFLNKSVKEVGPEATPATRHELGCRDLKEACINGKALAGWLDGFASAGFWSAIVL